MTSPIVRSRLTRLVWCLVLAVVSFGCGDPKLSASTKTDGGETGDLPFGGRLLFVSLPTREVAGTAFATPVQVALFRADGKIDTSWTGIARLSLGVNATVAELEGTLSSAAVAGIATFDGLSITHAATGYTLRAATDGYETVESLAFTVAPAPATTAVFLSQPSSRVAGQVFDPPLEIELRDAFNNPVTNLTTPVSLLLQVDGETPPDALLGTTSVTPVQGRALFADVTPTLAGKGLRLLVSVNDNVTATSRRFDVTPDSLAQLVITQQPGNITSDDKFDPPITIIVADQFGNRVSSEPRSISISLKNPFLGATLSGTTVASTLDGIAKFPGVSVPMAGKGYVVEARSGELTSALSNPFDVIPGVAASFRFLSDPVDVVAGVPFNPPIEVAVVDAHGNIVSDSLIPVTITMRSDNSSIPLQKPLTGTTTLGTVAGRALFTDLSCTEATVRHTNSLLASSPGLATFRGNSFTISPAAPATLSFMASPVSGVLGVPVISDLDYGPLYVTVLLQDIYENNITTPTPVTVSLVSPIPGAQLQGTLTVVTSAVNSTASFTDLIIDRVGYDYALEFSTAGVSSLRSNIFDVLQLSAVDSLSAGPNHTCALKDDLAMYCWGSNVSGQSQPRIPSGASSTVQMPTLTSERGGWQVLLSAASNVTCGLQPHGALFCRGDNSGGIFGNGKFVSSNKLTQESTTASWTSVAVGGAHACAVRSDGTMWCWGAGAAGQRGDGESGSAVLATSTPAPELSGSLWRSVSAGLTHTCGIKIDGSLWCWGEGADGQLGTGSTSQSDVAVRESSNATWLSVDCGDNHTCGIKADGSLWCWGRNDRGQLGNDTRTSSSVPVRENSQKSWKQVSAGSSHTCGIRTDGALWCWGAGAAGQLGDGRAQTDNTIPVQENSASEWTTVVTGASHTCGLKTDRSLWCWGSNVSGQLGTGGGTTSKPEQEQLKALWGP